MTNDGGDRAADDSPAPLEDDVRFGPGDLAGRPSAGRPLSALSPILRELRERLGLRRLPLLAGVAIILALVPVAALPLPAALAAAALSALALLAMPWPGRTGPASTTASRARVGPTGAAGWAEVVEAMPDGAILVRRDGIVVASNAAAREILDHIAPGSRIAGILRNPEVLAAIDEALETGEMRQVRYDERVPVERHLEAVASLLGPLRPADGTPQLLLVLRDLTATERLDVMRTDFIANASHELRTPLTSLIGFIETLQGPAREDAEARRKFLGVMATQAQRMKRLIDDMLVLTRVESHAHLRPRERVDASRVVEQVVESLVPVAEAAGQTLTLAVPPAPTHVRGDRDELAQVLQNLVHNAIRYGRSGGHVTVTVSRREADAGGSGERILMAIADDGIGIPARHLPRLTERFYRVDTAASRDRGGTGLGLAIVKHIVARHRGELRIRSREGEGSTFTVELPAEQGPLSGD
ncbi:MAG: ATP-binding protein [Hyphomicrobiaceae bacterium]